MFRLGSLTLSLLLLSLCVAGRFIRTIVPQSEAINNVGELLTPLRQLSSEATLARGGRIPLSSAQFEDLLLIPGISDTLATNILLKREAVLASAALRKKEPWRALELVHGIASKTARKLSFYLAVER